MRLVRTAHRRAGITIIIGGTNRRWRVTGKADAPSCANFHPAEPYRTVERTMGFCADRSELRDRMPGALRTARMLSPKAAPKRLVSRGCQ
jgi:hypothetical protein